MRGRTRSGRARGRGLRAVGSLPLSAREDHVDTDPGGLPGRPRYAPRPSPGRTSAVSGTHGGQPQVRDEHGEAVQGEPAASAGAITVGKRRGRAGASGHGCEPARSSGREAEQERSNGRRLVSANGGRHGVRRRKRGRLARGPCGWLRFWQTIGRSVMAAPRTLDALVQVRILAAELCRPVRSGDSAGMPIPAARTGTGQRVPRGRWLR
jgi:hypothetical protein